MTKYLEQPILDMDNNPVMKIISAVFNRALLYCCETGDLFIYQINQQ